MLRLNSMLNLNARFSALLLASALPFAAALQAQTPATTPTPAAPAPATVPAATQEPSKDQLLTIVTGTRLVPLVFTVTDKNGNFITGLKRSDFGLLDDGRPPARVISFTQQTNLPLRIGIMLDTSSSIRTRFQFEQDSALDFFLQVLHPDDRAFVEGFDVTTDLTQDYSNNVDLLNQGIRKLRPGGGTALFDALYHTCQAQMLTLREDVPVRKAIILVSDGEDNYSRATQLDAIKMCERAETIVYTISTDTSPTHGKGADVLSAISKATGGRLFESESMEDLAKGFASIEVELRSQYLLEYAPAEFKQDGSFRTIYLHATDRRYDVRSRTGYFAPKPNQ